VLADDVYQLAHASDLPKKFSRDFETSTNFRECVTKSPWLASLQGAV
jgi:hypothetical protein